MLRQHGIVPSMSRPANPYDNAFCESFMRTLKREEIDATSIATWMNCEPTSRSSSSSITIAAAALRAGIRPPEEFEQMAAVRAQAGEFGAASMSFSGMGKSIDGIGRRRRTASPAHPIDESPAGYSLAGCSPAEPDSASPAEAMVNQDRLSASQKTANSKCAQ